MPLDAKGNVKYLEFMAMFDSSKGAKSLLDDKSIMTHHRKAWPQSNSLRTGTSESINKVHSSKRTTDQITKIIHDLLKKNYRAVEEALTELDGMNTHRLSPESTYQLLKRFDIHPFISRAEVRKLWRTLSTSQDDTLDFYEFVRHFRFSPKTACFPNARLQPPVKGDGDFLIRSRKLNCDAEIVEDSLRAKVVFLLEQLWKHFHELDQFHTGFVSKEEFKDVLTDLCVELNEQECETLISKYNHGENRISYLEFLRPFEVRRKSPRLGNLKKQKDVPLPTVYTDSVHKGLNIITGKLRQKLADDWKILQGACKKLDCRSSGYLSVPEFRSVLQLCNIILEEDEIYHIMSKCDEDTVGKIDYSKLISKLFKGT
ncbi:EF-hand calcium-binding domain-containing protein 6-like [Callorhinchus milii]|uniref:EF-hand calcium-binding domain-containing protein 6-like n=1 Tax=Callorhinchus milii TaxID=7868 RepID=UPI001C3FAEEF|nr:EF-hand calcium-binding domain-containing protein 6-like [Callorhinchus milii]